MTSAARKQGTVVLSADELHDLVTNAVREALNTNAPAEYLTLAQAAQMMGASERSLRTWVKDDGLPALRAGRDYRFRRESLVQWMERRPLRKVK